jgi:hypothetical protein
MKDVRVDTVGELRCWHCGCTSFTEQRTMRSKVLVGVGALLTKKKLKCRICGEYNDLGSARPYKGPDSKRLGKKYGTFVAMFGSAEPDRVIALAISENAGAAPPPGPPAGWHPDPHSRHELRYWNGTQWTDHVSDRGVTGVDNV